MDGESTVTIKNLNKWDNDILIERFVTHLLTMMNNRTQPKIYKHRLEKHHLMLKEIKRRMSEKESQSHSKNNA